MEKSAARNEELQERGINSRHYLDYSHSAENEVLRALKGKWRGLSLHDFSELKEEYEAWGKPKKIVLMRRHQPVKNKLIP